MPTVTHLDLHNTVIAVLKPLWDAWSSSYPFPSHAEMHRSPKLLLYDPTQPNVPSGPAILDFFYTTRGRAASTVFQPSKRITILLIITHDVYEAALEWKEQKMVLYELLTTTKCFVLRLTCPICRSRVILRHLKRSRLARFPGLLTIGSTHCLV